MKGLTLLRGPADWQRHCAETAMAAGKTTDQVVGQVEPQMYPCLIATVFVPETARLLSCLVFPADAVALLAAARPAADVPGPTRQDHDRHVAAMLLTLTEYMVETGIAKPKDFEARLAKQRRVVDEEATRAADLAAGRDVPERDEPDELWRLVRGT